MPRVMVVWLLGCVLASGGIVVGCGGQAPRPVGQRPAQRGEAEVEQARARLRQAVAGEMHTPWRNSGQWREMHAFSSTPGNVWEYALERDALLRLVRQLPGGPERIEAHLRLARQNRSLSARGQVLEAQRLLREEFVENPGAPGLLRAAVDANRIFGWYELDTTTEFFEIARGYVEGRYRAGGADAAEAGFRLAQMLVGSDEETLRERERVLAEVVERFPESEWAGEAEFALIGLRHKLRRSQASGLEDDEYLREYVSLADRRAGEAVAARALMWAAQGYGFGEYGEAQHGDGPHMPRLERAMELHVRYQREYPGVEWRDPNRSYAQQEPSISLWGKRREAADCERLEALAIEYYALNPRGSTELLTTLPHLKRDLPLAEFPAFYRRFWDAVEQRAAAEMLPEVRLARAYFVSDGEPYSTQEYREQQLREASGILAQISKDFPRSEAAAVALDGRALLAVRLEDTEQALAAWDTLAERYPEHLLNRPAALDRVFLEHPRQRGALWRAALRKLAERYPEDPVISLCTRCLRAGSLHADGAHEIALEVYHTALPLWPTLFPADRLATATQSFSLGPLHEIRAGWAAQVGLAPVRSRPAETEFLSRQSAQTVAERIAVYGEMLELFPESPHFETYAWRLGEAQLEAEQFEAARDTFGRLAKAESAAPDVRLLSRLHSIRLEYQLAASADESAAVAAARELEAALRAYPTSAGSDALDFPGDPRNRDVASLYRHAYEVSRLSGNSLTSSSLEVLGRIDEREGGKKWYVVAGSDHFQVEFHDGLLLSFSFEPPTPELIAGRALRGLHPQTLFAALGVGDGRSEAFVRDVVSRVFVMNTEGYDAWFEPQSRGVPSTPPLEPAPAGPFVFELPTSIVEVKFYDAQRRRAEVQFAPHNCVSRIVFFTREGRGWKDADGRGWFRWEQY